MLTIIDSTYHVLKDMKDQSTIRFQEKQNQEKQGKPAEYKEKFSLTIPGIGISLVNSYPQVSRYKLVEFCSDLKIYFKIY